MELTKEDINNILLLIERVNITGKEAIPVAVLQQKLVALSNTKQDVTTNTETTEDLEGKE